MNPVKELQKYGQSVWLDYIRRNLVTSGELQRLIQEDGLRGMTSNPTIFEKAIAGSTDYDEALQALLREEVQRPAAVLFQALAIEDIQMAAEALRAVYDATGSVDGYVSLEVSPHLAHDTAGTIAEARRLWKAVDRPNIMIKVPATREGIPAIEALTADGFNVNITLMFSLAHYEAVAHAYLRGLEQCRDPHRLHRVASVASFFVSRVDTAVDAALEAIGTPDALALRGKIAIANAKQVYRRFRQIFHGERFAALRERGARVQRPLWASTGTKNPAYSDVLYIEELVGKDTVTTVPPGTLNAFREHGRVRAALEERMEEADAVLNHLRALEIDLDSIAEKLLSDGVKAFAVSFEQLMTAVERKRHTIMLGRADRQILRLGANQAAVNKRLRAWQAENFACRLWRKDPTLWSPKPVPEITDRLGWLTLPETMHEQLDALKAFGQEAQAEGIRHVVLQGMGGSSLAPEVFQRMFGNASGYPELIVLDSTHPAAVRAVEAELDLRRTLFLVSSKSGTTTETLSFFRYFWQRASQVTGAPGHHFVAITDPMTPLERLARERGFRAVFRAQSDVGGRYSALTLFGLVPAALIGLDIHRLLNEAWTMSEACAFCVPGANNSGLTLGAALGEAALAGRDKITFLTSPSLAPFPAWAEQLIAESTGKNGKGIVPVVEEPARPPDTYAADRLFVYLHLKEETDVELRKQVDALEAAGFPTLCIQLNDRADLGQEFFRWEVAVAAAGAALGIHPFDQPDVELAKQLAREAMKQKQCGASAASSGEAEPVAVEHAEQLRQALKTWLAGARPADYIALQAYLPPSAATTTELQAMRASLLDRFRLATTLGYGPRFLHSTGQLHKGGPNTGLFLQIIDDVTEDVPVPETDYTFGELIRAQALGDYQALRQRDRRVLRVSVGSDVARGLRLLEEALRR